VIPRITMGKELCTRILFIFINVNPHVNHSASTHSWKTLSE
jgi:hypothetical protein